MPSVGNFTSSEIVALVSCDKSGKNPGKPFYTYINECNMERKLGRLISAENDVLPLSWGTLVQKLAFNVLDTSYSWADNETLTHPMIDCWRGRPDVITEDTVGDIKCPLTLKSFCTFVDAWKEGGIEKIRDNHQDGEKFYWQLVSNSILTKKKFGELIVFAPYLSQLQSIRDMAFAYDGADAYKYKRIAYKNDEELPFLIEGGYYKNLYQMRFEIPAKDKFFLHERVELAQTYLIKEPVTA